MVHTIAKLTLFFKLLFCGIVAIGTIFGVYCFGNVMLVGKYHILPCYKTEHKRPGAKDMISTFLQNKQCYLQYKAKVINKMLIIFLKRNNVVNCMS
jgi:hypothetical protein